MKKNKILIWGAGSQALIAKLMIENNLVYYKNKKVISNEILYLVDPFLKKPSFKSNIKFINNKIKFRRILKKVNSFIVCVGAHHGYARYSISKELIKLKLKPLSIISNTAYIDTTCKLGLGLQIMPNVVVNCYSKIDDFCLLNTSSTIEHQCNIGKGTHIMGSASITGGVNIKKFSTIGTGASILPGVIIHQGAYVGAGSVVKKNVLKNDVVVGVPAKFLKKNNQFLDLSFFR